MSAYYRRIKGKNYDRELMDLAEASVSGRGDGRISLADARKLLAGVKDADSYTDVEKRTIKYIRENFKFTKEADAMFRKEIRKWAGTRAARTRKAAAPAPDSTEPEQDNDALMGSAANYESRATGGGESSGWPWGKILFIVLFLLLIILLIFLGLRYCKSDGSDNTGSLDKPGSSRPLTEPGAKISAASVESTVPAFQRGSSSISPNSATKLKTVTGYLKQNPGARLRITGHTCNIGSKKLNLRYSRRRAASVAGHLRAQGIESKRIEIRAAGESSPIARNTSEAGRRKNRRVQFKILK